MAFQHYFGWNQTNLKWKYRRLKKSWSPLLQVLFIQDYSVLFGGSFREERPKVDLIIQTWDSCYSCNKLCGRVRCLQVPVSPILQVNLAVVAFLLMCHSECLSPQCFCQCISFWLWIIAFVGGVVQPQCADGCDSWVLRWVVLSWDLMADVIRPVSQLLLWLP